MIKINLPYDYFDDGKVKEIFEKLAKKIKKDTNLKKYTILDSTGKEVQSEEQIYQFLISEDFYKYRLKGIDSKNLLSIIITFKQMSTNTDVTTITNGTYTGNSEQITKFYELVSSFVECANFKSSFQEYIKKENLSDKKLSNEIKSNFLLSNDLYKPYLKHFKIIEVFDYEQLLSKVKSGQDRHTIISKMNVSVCPYCNMNYTISFDKKGVNSTTADLDHFYPKSIHPLYALCLYNFIPSCHTCNSTFKGSKDMQVDTHIYPYTDSSDDNITFKHTKVLSVLLEPKKDRKTTEFIKVSCDKSNEKAQNSIKTFNLQERYKHFEYLGESLLEKSQIYNDSYTKEIKDLFKGDIDAKSLIFGQKLTEEEMLNESLGKFKNDLLKQFGIFK